MKTSQLTKKLGGTILGLVMVLGIGFAFSTSAQAQYRSREEQRRERARLEQERLEQERREQAIRNGTWNRNQTNDTWNQGQNNGVWNRNRNRRGRNGDSYGNYGGTFELRQTALNAGYNEGIKEGRNDRRKGDRYEFRDESAFQKATKDYSSRLGDRGIYSRYFREAFQNGYDAGYNGY
jgi:hypothetical protein